MTKQMKPMLNKMGFLSNPPYKKIIKKILLLPLHSRTISARVSQIFMSIISGE